MESIGNYWYICIKYYDNYSRRLQEKILTMKESSDTESNVSGGSRPLSGVSPGDTPRHYKVSGGSRPLSCVSPGDTPHHYKVSGGSRPLCGFVIRSLIRKTGT